jgi:hypothetical protein
MAGADLQKSPVLFIGAFTQVPRRPLGAAIGMTFQSASFGKHIAKLFTCAIVCCRLITGYKACRKCNRKPDAAAGGTVDILARVTAGAIALGTRLLADN